MIRSENKRIVAWMSVGELQRCLLSELMKTEEQKLLILTRRNEAKPHPAAPKHCASEQFQHQSSILLIDIHRW